MAVASSLRRWLGRKVYQIEVTFAVNMFAPWERFVFWSIVFLLSSLTFIAAILYLPHHVAILAGRVWYYINGENIDVAASAREVVKDMTSSVLRGGPHGVDDAATAIVTTGTRSLLGETVETLHKEL